jgi:hypothetical protein
VSYRVHQDGSISADTVDEAVALSRVLMLERRRLSCDTKTDDTAAFQAAIDQAIGSPEWWAAFHEEHGRDPTPAEMSAEARRKF